MATVPSSGNFDPPMVTDLNGNVNSELNLEVGRRTNIQGSCYVQFKA